MRRMAFRPAGYRRSIEKRLTEKREASAFIDVTTAEDSGKFPDMNVANALQRVPGVVNTADGGEGSGVPPRPSNFLPLPSINKQKTFGLLVGGVWQVCINRELRKYVRDMAVAERLRGAGQCPEAHNQRRWHDVRKQGCDLLLAGLGCDRARRHALF